MACGDDAAAHGGGYGVAGVVGYLDEGGAEEFAAAGVAHDGRLQGAAAAEHGGGAQEGEHHHGPLAGGERGNQGQEHERAGLHAAGHERGLEAAAELAGQEVAAEHAQAGQEHDPAEGGVGEAADACEQRVDVAVPAVDAALAYEHAAEDEPRGQRGEEAELRAQAVAAGQGAHEGQPQAQEQQREAAGDACGEECQAPGHGLGQPCAQGHAHEIGHGHAGYHERHCLHLAAGGCEAAGHDGAHAEVGAVGQAGDEARHQHEVVAGGGRGHEVAGAYHGGQEHHHAAQGHLAQHQQQHGAHAHAGGVGRDEMACGGDAHAQAGGYVDEDAHHHEFGDAQGECSEREGEECFVHRFTFSSAKVYKKRNRLSHDNRKTLTLNLNTMKNTVQI